jgi:hypothetical protein
MLIASMAKCMLYMFHEVLKVESQSGPVSLSAVVPSKGVNKKCTRSGSANYSQCPGGGSAARAYYLFQSCCARPLCVCISCLFKTVALRHLSFSHAPKLLLKPPEGVLLSSERRARVANLQRIANAISSGRF